MLESRAMSRLDYCKEHTINLFLHGKYGLNLRLGGDVLPGDLREKMRGCHVILWGNMRVNPMDIVYVLL